MLGRYLIKSLKPLCQSFKPTNISPLFLFSEKWHQSLAYSGIFMFSQKPEVMKVELNENLYTPQMLNEFANKANQAPWGQAVNYLLQASFFQPHEIEAFDNLFQIGEKRFLSREVSFTKPQQVIQLATAFGKSVRGSTKFWDTICSKFGVYYDTNKYSLDEVAQFVFASADYFSPTEEFWESLEKTILDKNPKEISADAVAMLMSAMTSSYQNMLDPLDTDPNEQFDENELDVQKSQLWIVLKELAIKKIPASSFYAIVTLGQTFAENEIQDSGFWLLLEDRFQSLKEALSPIEVSRFALIMGLGKQGTKKFWEEMEIYLLTSMDALPPLNVRNIVEGFARAEQGSTKLWSGIQNYIITSPEYFPPLVVGSLAVCLSIYEIGKSKVWDALQTRALKDLKNFDFKNLLNLISGFGNSRRGNENFWAAVEDCILNLEDATKDKRLTLYIMLKNVNRLSPKLTSYFQDVSDAGDQWTASEEAQQEEIVEEEQAGGRNTKSDTHS